MVRQSQNRLGNTRKCTLRSNHGVYKQLVWRYSLNFIAEINYDKKYCKHINNVWFGNIVQARASEVVNYYYKVCYRNSVAKDNFNTFVKYNQTVHLSVRLCS